MKRNRFIEQYHMIPHAEGGYYAETWQQKEQSVSHIFYLLPQGETARWHRLNSDELWLFHHGEELTVTLGGQGESPAAEKEIRLNGENLQCFIPGGTWQKAAAGNDDVLVSCIVSPAFRWEQWELYTKEQDK